MWELLIVHSSSLIGHRLSVKSIEDSPWSIVHRLIAKAHRSGPKLLAQSPKLEFKSMITNESSSPGEGKRIPGCIDRLYLLSIARQ